jgi:TRAP-type C4-dicarboxylate transport system substrate-binding protein
MNATTKIHLSIRGACAVPLAFGLAMGIAGLGTVMQARAADFTMKIGLSSAEDTEHFYARGMKEVIEAKSNGKIEVQIFPRGQLGSQSATIQGLQLGSVEGFITPGDFYQGIDPRMGVLSFAFLFKDRAHANRVLSKPAIQEKVASILDQKGIIGCGQIATSDVRYMAHSPLRKLADFNGKKFRINGTDAERERFRRLGVTSVAMNLADMLTALQNKTIDGSGSGTTIFVNFNLDTVSKELLQVEDTLIVSYCGMSKKWLDTLPADLRAMVIKESRQVFYKAIKAADDFNVTLGKRWEAKGGKFNQLSVAEQKEVREKLATVGEVVTEGKSEMRALYNEIKAVSASTP